MGCIVSGIIICKIFITTITKCSKTATEPSREVQAKPMADRIPETVAETQI